MEEPTTQETGGENSGFITSGKGITLSVVSLCTWALTQILYKMTSIITGKGVSYEVFCLFASFTLSALGGYYIVKQLYNKKDKLRNVAMGLNILLIYSSANGIQAGIAASSSESTQRANGSTGEITSMQPVLASLFGFIDVRPWLPDLTSKQTINQLKTENEILKGRINVEPAIPLIEDARGSEMEKYREFLIDSIRNTIIIVDKKTDQNIDAYIELRNRFLQKEETDERFRGAMAKYRDFISRSLGAGYLDSLLLYPLK